MSKYEEPSLEEDVAFLIKVGSKTDNLEDMEEITEVLCPLLTFFGVSSEMKKSIKDFFIETQTRKFMQMRGKPSL